MYLYINGDVYEGEWKDNKRQGKGVYTCAATKLKVCSDPIILSFNIAKHGLPVKYRSLIPWVFFGLVCAVRDSKLAPRSKTNFP